MCLKVLVALIRMSSYGKHTGLAVVEIGTLRAVNVLFIEVSSLMNTAITLASINGQIGVSKPTSRRTFQLCGR